MSKNSVPDRFYNGGDFNDIYFRQRQDANLTNKKRNESPVPPTNTFQRLLDSLPTLPVHNPGCTCEICVGTKTCPECSIRSMYLDKKRRIWRCIKCHGYDVVRDPTQKPHNSYNDNPNIKRLEEWLRPRNK